MKAHEEVFISLVRNSLWDTPVEVPDGFKSWGLVMRMSKVQAMQGSVAKGLLDSPDILARMRPDAYVRLSDMVMMNAGMHSKADCSLQVLVLELRKAGIEPVLLKGQGLAANYRYPEVRQCGDVDLYVGVENYRKSYEVLKMVVDEIDEPSCLDGDGKHYHAQLAGTMIEVHRYSEVSSIPSVGRIYQRYASEGLSQNLVEVAFKDLSVLTPADNFNAFYIFSHLWNHFLSAGVGLRQICDWAVFLHARGSNVDRDYLRKILTELKLMTPWQTFGCIAVDILGLPVEDFPFYDAKYRSKARRVLDRILLEGNFGQETDFVRNPTRGFLYEKLFSLKCHLQRFFGLVSLFPYHAWSQVRSAVGDGFRRLVAEAFYNLNFK